MRLESRTLLFTQLSIEDLQYIHTFTSDYQSIAPYFTTKIRSQVYWETRFKKTGLWDDDYGMLLITSKSDQEKIGVIWFFRSLPYAEGYEIGFNFFNPATKDRTHISSAMRIFSAYLFETYNIPRIQCNTLAKLSSENFDKFREEVGFVYEGTMRNAMFIRGELVDLQLFSMLREESRPLGDLLAKL